MSEKQKIDIEYVINLYNLLQKINNLDFNSIEWYENGEKLNIDQKIIDDFKFTGLSNYHFIISEFYKDGFKQLKQL